jgi:hypothetical protein
MAGIRPSSGVSSRRGIWAGIGASQLVTAEMADAARSSLWKVEFENDRVGDGEVSR